MEIDYARCSRGTVSHASRVPAACKSRPCVLGIDEAGRGPVLGPMVYAVCYVPQDCEKELRVLGAADSKTMSELRREAILERLLAVDSEIPLGYAYTALAASEISQGMLRRRKYNLNEIAFDTTVGLIAKVLDSGVNLVHIFVDTVGPPETYRDRLKRRFPRVPEITVAKKADALYPCVGAASVVAKVTRDRVLANWEFQEDARLKNLALKSTRDWGSGYPSDPKACAWLRNSMDPIFGWPSVVRFSWATAATMIKERGVAAVDWPEERLEKESQSAPSIMSSMSAFSETLAAHNSAYSKRQITPVRPEDLKSLFL